MCVLSYVCLRRSALCAIACAMSPTVIVRVSARHKEVALRQARAIRGRLIRQLLTGPLVLSFSGAVVGGSRVMESVFYRPHPSYVPRRASQDHTRYRWTFAVRFGRRAVRLAPALRLQSPL